MVQNSDEEDVALMLQVTRGDRAAFARLFDRHQQGVVRFCARFVGNRAQAEDLAQDVFLKLFRSASRYRPSARFKTFLFRVAANHCLNELRRPAGVGNVSDHSTDKDRTTAAQEIDALTPQHALEGREAERVMNQALTAMTERERVAFSLCRFEGLSYSEIAEALEASESAVKSLIHRGTVQMMSHLERFNTASVHLEGNA